MKEYIDIDKCSAFEQIILLLMTNHKEDELREEDKKCGFTCLGEIERFSRFGIDFTHLDCIQDLIGLPDRDPRWALENKIQDVAKSMLELYEMLENVSTEELEKELEKRKNNEGNGINFGRS